MAVQPPHAHLLVGINPPVRHQRPNQLKLWWAACLTSRAIREPHDLFNRSVKS
jgi:hypothetical protein